LFLDIDLDLASHFILRQYSQKHVFENVFELRLVSFDFMTITVPFPRDMGCRRVQSSMISFNPELSLSSDTTLLQRG